MKRKKANVTQIGTTTGIAIVIANMIGTGAFTSLGFQVKDIPNNSTILLLWILGGIVALCGAFSYAEVGTFVKKSGGEYAFLSKLYHPIVGFLSGWISLTAGFSAPIALSAIAAVEYFPARFTNPKLCAILLVALITLIHTRSIHMSALFQNITTLLKIVLILIFIGIGCFVGQDVGNRYEWGQESVHYMLSPAFAVALIYVSYSYSGWNAAAYITSEFKKPEKSLPLALIGGTLIVTLLYTLLQYVFLRCVPVEDLKGKLDIGVLAITNILGARMAHFFGVVISLLLISGLSAMVWVGARIPPAMGDDYQLWRHFKIGKKNIPQKALWLQFLLTTLLIATGSFERILVYCGFLLTLSTMFVVAGTIIIRRKNKNQNNYTFRSPLYPFFQIIYLVVSCWIIYYACSSYPKESIFGILNLLVGVGIYFCQKLIGKK